MLELGNPGVRCFFLAGHRDGHGSKLVLDDGTPVAVRSDTEVEESAGAALMRIESGQPQVLLIRVRQEGYELPKGHIEAGETAEESALRELREETGILSSVAVGPQLGTLEYSFKNAGAMAHKRVSCFVAMPEPRGVCEFGKKPSRTKELLWIGEQDLESVALVNEELRFVLEKAFRFFKCQ